VIKHRVAAAEGRSDLGFREPVQAQTITALPFGMREGRAGPTTHVEALELGKTAFVELAAACMGAVAARAYLSDPSTPEQ